MEKNFNYQNLPIRVKTDNDEQIWFAGIDICKILGYTNPDSAIKKLDEDLKKLTLVKIGSGQNRKTWMINEPGLYDLVLSSSKPEAKSFRKWVIGTVLPSIRKAGKYTTSQEANRDISMKKMVDQIDKLKLEREETKTKLYDLNRTITRLQNELSDFIKEDKSQQTIPFPEFSNQ